MLPKRGTKERELLEKEALLIGEHLLEQTDGEIAQALYLTYTHFREKFLKERDLMDTVITVESSQELKDEWDEAKADAMAMRQFVDYSWAGRILA